MRQALAAAVLTLSVAAQSRPARPAPDLVFRSRTGQTVRLADYRGRQPVVLLVLRGFNGKVACHFCGVQARDWKSRYEAARAAGAEVLMVLPGATDAAGFLAKVGAAAEPAEPGFDVPFPLVLDPECAACGALAITTQPVDDVMPFPVDEPATFVVSKDGVITYEYRGKDPSDRPTAAAVLAALRGEAGTPVASQPASVATSLPAGPAIAWQPYAAGLTRAAAERRPILLEFHAVW